MVVKFEFDVGKYIRQTKIGITLIANLSNNFFQGEGKYINERGGILASFMRQTFPDNC
jgi:hypothetical protein